MTEDRRQREGREAEETMNSLRQLFGMTPGEERQMKAALKLDEYQALARVILVPRYAVFDGEAFWDRVERRVLSPAQLDNADVVVRDFGYRGDRSPIAPHTLLCRDPDRVSVQGLVSLPGRTDEFADVPNPSGAVVRMANTWRPSQVVAAAGDYDPPLEWLEHQAWMIRDPAEFAWWLDWQAYKTQHPSAYLPLAPMLVGEPGTGKDLSIGLFALINGVHNLARVSMTRLGLPYDEFLASQYVYCAEMTFGGRSGVELYDRFKSWTGASGGFWTDLNVKTKAMQQAMVQPTFMFSTNAENCLAHVPSNDRRLCVVGCDGFAGKYSAQDFAELAQLYASPAYAARVKRWLMDRDVRAFSTNAPLKGPTRERYLNAGLSDGAAEAFNLVVHGALADRTAFSYREVAIQLSRNWHNQTVWAGLERAGCKHLLRSQGAGARDTIYSGAHVDAVKVVEMQKMPPDELKAIVSAESGSF